MNDVLNHLDNQVEAALVTALMHDPENVVALMNMGRHFEAHDRDQEADGMYRNALAVQPDHPEALLALGRLLHLYPAFRDEAIAFLQRMNQVVGVELELPARLRRGQDGRCEHWTARC